MTCECRTGARCLPCMERDGLTSPALVRRVRVTLPHLPNILQRGVRALAKLERR